jgi:thymidylate synthase (FAD)
MQFSNLGNVNTDTFPGFHPTVYTTTGGTSYLREPGCQLIARPICNIQMLSTFFKGFDESLGFQEYLEDDLSTHLTHGERLIKFAGQGCYAAFGPNRRKNSQALDYLTNIKKEAHGSVFEHVSFSFFLYGISRSLTHELVRHRQGVGFSQLSQRYVDGKVLRFVEGPEYQNDPMLHGKFLRDVDQAVEDYNFRAARLMEMQIAKDPSLYSDEAKKSDLRKKVNQAARRRLPNEVETWMVFTGNVRALRHILEMRAAGPAEVEVRRLAMMMYRCLVHVEPSLFADYKVIEQADGTFCVETPYRKV